MKKKNLKKTIQIALLPIAIMVFMTGCTNESSEPTVIAAELTAMNVIYVGVENPLTIAASNLSINDLDVTFSPGKITGSNGQYMLMPAKVGKAKLSIQSNGELLGEKHFRALAIPNPTAGVKFDVDGKTKFMKKGEISLVDLVNIDEVTADLKDFLFETDFKVTSFYVNILGTKGISILEKSDSNLFTEAQKNLFRRLGPGQHIIIKEIKAIGPDGLERELNDITLKIAE